MFLRISPNLLNLDTTHVFKLNPLCVTIHTRFCEYQCLLLVWVYNRHVLITILVYHLSDTSPYKVDIPQCKHFSWQHAYQAFKNCMQHQRKDNRFKGLT
jgi:hypothetical protein